MFLFKYFRRIEEKEYNVYSPLDDFSDGSAPFVTYVTLNMDGYHNNFERYKCIIVAHNCQIFIRTLYKRNVDIIPFYVTMNLSGEMKQLDMMMKIEKNITNNTITYQSLKKLGFIPGR